MNTRVVVGYLGAHIHRRKTTTDEKKGKEDDVFLPE
jgi:hypothetical protein